MTSIKEQREDLKKKFPLEKLTGDFKKMTPRSRMDLAHALYAPTSVKDDIIVKRYYEGEANPEDYEGDL